MAELREMTAALKQAMKDREAVNAEAAKKSVWRKNLKKLPAHVRAMVEADVAEAAAKGLMWSKPRPLLPGEARAYSHDEGCGEIATVSDKGKVTRCTEKATHAFYAVGGAGEFMQQIACAKHAQPYMSDASREWGHE